MAGVSNGTGGVSGAIRTAVVSLGRAGWGIHVKTLRRLPDRFVVAAVMDPDAGRRAEASAELGCAAHEALEPILADPSIELVVVASPNHLHGSHTIASLRAGKHVVCEKPFALSADEADRMIETARACGRVLAPFQNRRYEAHYRKVREIIGSGALGEVLQVRMCWHRFGRRWDWQTMRRFGGGALCNNGTHLLDQALQLVEDDEPDVFIDTRRGLTAGDADEHLKLLIRPRSGPTIDIELTNACAYEQDRWHVMGTAGGLRGTMSRLEWRTVDWSSMPERSLDLGPAEGRRYQHEEIDWAEHTWEAPADAPTPSVELYEDVHGAIRSAGRLLVTPESVRRYVALLDRGAERGEPSGGERATIVTGVGRKGAACTPA